MQALAVFLLVMHHVPVERCAGILEALTGERPSDGFVLGDLPGAVAVHDRYRNYDACGAVAHQLCCAHLLRDLADAAEQCPDAIWPGKAADALRALIPAANTARSQGPSAAPADTTAAGDVAQLA